jgi:hypothetical protein
MTQSRFLPARLALILAAIALCQGLTACWITGALGSWLPLSGAIPLPSLPHILCGMAVALSALAAPFLAGARADAESGEPLPRSELTLIQAAFAALWQGGMFCYFLMVCGRLVPLEPGGIALASVWVAVAAFCCLLLTQALPRAYAGIVFFWIVAVPMTGYITADVFLFGPGSGGGWQPIENNRAIYTFVHALLNISPATATAAALDGALPDGALAAPLYGLAGVLIVSAALAVLIWKRNRRPSSLTESARLTRSPIPAE